MTRRALTCVLISTALALSACGGETTSLRASEEQPVSAEAATVSSLAVDLRPLHSEAVELADLVLAAGASPEVAAVVQEVRQQQLALLDDVDAQLRAAGVPPAEAGAVVAELQDIRGAAGDEAVRLGLTGLFTNHLAALTRAKAAVTEGVAGAERVLADRVLEQQGAALEALGELT